MSHFEEDVAYPCDCRNRWIYSGSGEVYCDSCGVVYWFLDLGLTTDNIIQFYDENDEDDVEMIKGYRIAEAGGEMQYSYKRVIEGIV
tara:strand:+ start:52 stop:312 length:261 start_codon:yes stop_codon:yes gene_type:complete